MKEIKWSAEAAADLESIKRSIAQDSPSYATISIERYFWQSNVSYNTRFPAVWFLNLKTRITGRFFTVINESFTHRLKTFSGFIPLCMVPAICATTT